MAKLLEADKLRGGLRRVYVSWDESDTNKTAWIKAFWERIVGQTRLRRQAFAGALQTGDATAGSFRKDWVTPEGEPVTDFVALLTDAYINANIDSDRPAEGELATFIDRVLRGDDEDRLRVFLAPVDPPEWRFYEVRAVRLGDPDGTYASWLARLREDRFPWPNDPGGGRYTEEIAAAVRRILDEPPQAKAGHDD